MSAIVYSFSFPHHGEYSSFHHLCDYLGDQIVVDSTFTPPDWLPAQIQGRLIRYWRQYGEYRLWGYYYQPKSNIFHYLRPENTMRCGWKWKRNNKLIMSCHQPIQKLAEMKSAGKQYEGFFNGLAHADVVVVLSKTHIEGYKYYAPNADVLYIPLGVDTEFFAPSSVTSTRSPMVLTVGSWLRDYACWADVVRNVLSKENAADFVVVANDDTIKKARAYLAADHAKVRFLSGITDEQLRNLYQQASLLFLPLQDAVANNALLEAMATGVPSIVTKLPATKEYLGDQAGVLVTDHSPDSYSSCITKLLDDPILWQEKSQLSLARAREYFSWQHIADEYRSLYRSLS
ncbi:MAG: glycosyltransferase family 4 protein [Thiotrichales bacterium]|nr:glycosyltransferase family 4 protein [Thiotrichales bacterium]